VGGQGEDYDPFTVFGASDQNRSSRAEANDSVENIGPLAYDPYSKLREIPLLTDEFNRNRSPGMNRNSDRSVQ